MLLVATIIDILGVARAKDIRDWLREWDYNLDRDELHKYLVILEKLGIITRFKYGRPDYYSHRAGKGYLQYRFHSKTIRGITPLLLELRASMASSDDTWAKAFRYELKLRKKAGQSR